MSLISRSRRHFLSGSGGALLALPILPSLYTSDAQAQAAATQKFFVHMLSWHGGVYQNKIFPQPAAPAETATFAGFQVRRTPLSTTTNGANAAISQVLSGPSNRLTPALVAKMNVINGLDVPFYASHNSAIALGNFADTDGDDGAKAQGNRMTIDQIMAWSPSFYRGTVAERAIITGDWRTSSWTWSNPTARSGTFQRTGKSAETNVGLFDKLFKTSTAPQRPLIVDQVLASYKTLRDGNVRLSAADKQRLSEHMDRIAELQRKLQATVNVAAPSRPATDNGSLRGSAGYDVAPARQVQSETLWNDIVVAAFAAGLSSIHTRTAYETFSAFGGDWHAEIAHMAQSNPGAAQTLADAYQTYFAGVVLDLASKLDAVPSGAGGTLLDNTLMAWSHEAGNLTHIPTGVPVITFGSAGGWMRTGQYLDYRNLGKQANGDQTRWHGLLMHNWCHSALQAMGIPSTEYEKPAVTGGYPDFKYNNVLAWFRYGGAEDPYPAATWNVTGQVLPWFKV